MPNARWRRYLRIAIVVGCIAQLSSGYVDAQNKRDKFDPDGAFWIHGQPPNEFSDFSAINLNAKRVRRLPAAGLQLNNGKNFRFKTLSTKPQELAFTTLVIAGVSYSFSGKFLKTGVFATGMLDDETPVLEGTLTKFKAGKKVAEANLKFVYFGGT
ncbi:MAG TPA: hypothetical protein VFH91_05390 [Pyrinomonadaceae bacterium]|nr:hypothetical protein [Pyrinomonadaceae bacterium]